MKTIFKRISSMIACLTCIISISTNTYARSHSVDKRDEYTEVVSDGYNDNSGIALCDDDNKRPVKLPYQNGGINCK